MLRAINAVCFMTTAHLNLLRHLGAARNLMRYRSPIPRGPLKEGVIVDDYDVPCIMPRTMRANEPAEDAEALSRARQGYASVGIRTEEKKTFVARENPDSVRVG